MKVIELTKGQVAIVDDEDFERLAQWRWRNCNGYAVRSHPTMKRRVIWMHREILQTPDGFDTDHINGNKADNRKCNLRVATRSENKFNVGKRSDNTTGFKGVFWHSSARKFRAQITIGGHAKHLGYFATAEEASRAYNTAALSMHGEFVRIN